MPKTKSVRRGARSNARAEARPSTRPEVRPNARPNNRSGARQGAGALGQSAPRNGGRGGSGATLAHGQNFLTSARTINRLLDKTSLCRADHVVEIGPGKGHITRALLGRCGRVSAVELDEALHARLARQFAGEEALALHRSDFLRWPLPAGPYKVFANIPFCRTSDIIRRLAEAQNPPAEMWLVMEKGAAKRFMGRPAETRASLATKPVFHMEFAWHFRREDFHPAPRVDAVLVHFTRKSPPDVASGRRRRFLAMVNAVLEKGPQAALTKRQVSTALRLAGLPPEFTPHNAEYVQWLCLFRCYNDINAGKPGGRGQNMKW